MVLIINKINTVKKLLHFVKYSVSVLGTRRKRPQILGIRYSAKFGTLFSPNYARALLEDADKRILSMVESRAKNVLWRSTAHHKETNTAIQEHSQRFSTTSVRRSRAYTVKGPESPGDLLAAIVKMLSNYRFQ